MFGFKYQSLDKATKVISPHLPAFYALSISTVLSSKQEVLVTWPAAECLAFLYSGLGFSHVRPSKAELRFSRRRREARGTDHLIGRR